MFEYAHAIRYATLTYPVTLCTYPQLSYAAEQSGCVYVHGRESPPGPKWLEKLEGKSDHVRAMWLLRCAFLTCFVSHAA